MLHRSLVLMCAISLSMVACGKGDGKNKSDAPTVSSESIITASKVKELLNGNTLIAKNFGEDKGSHSYHAKDGAVQMLGGKKRKGKWHVKDDGAYCVEFDGKTEKCRFFANDGKGGLIIVNESRKVVMTVDQIKPGKP